MDSAHFVQMLPCPPTLLHLLLIESVDVESADAKAKLYKLFCCSHIEELQVCLRFGFIKYIFNRSHTNFLQKASFSYILYVCFSYIML